MNKTELSNLSLIILKDDFIFRMQAYQNDRTKSFLTGNVSCKVFASFFLNLIFTVRKKLSPVTNIVWLK